MDNNTLENRLESLNFVFEFVYLVLSLIIYLVQMHEWRVIIKYLSLNSNPTGIERSFSSLFSIDMKIR